MLTHALGLTVKSDWSGQVPFFGKEARNAKASVRIAPEFLSFIYCAVLVNMPSE